MTTAVLSIGSNLGHRLGFLQLAVASLGRRVVASSPVYETEPWRTAGQNFLNAVLVVRDPELDARGWLREALRIEALAARSREHLWGPRTLDIDVVACYQEDGTAVTAYDPELSLPHPHAHERAFVLVPWLVVQPEARFVVGAWELSVKELVDRLDVRERAAVSRTRLSLTSAVLVR